MVGRKVFSIPILLLSLLLMLFSGCSTSPAAPDGDDTKITVYTSFYTMYDFTLKISGGKVDVVNMVPSGMEPHNWEPSPRDIAGLSHADLFIYNGAGMEGWAEKVLASINNPKLLAIETSKDIKLNKAPHEPDHDEESKDTTGHSHDDLEYDPHVWLYPLNAKKQMEAIRDGLIQVDPQNSRFYQENFRVYAEKLDALDQAYQAAAATFTKKEIVVSHQAFGYLCDAYGLKQMAIEGLSSEFEPTPAKMAKIIDFVNEHDVRVIFFEELTSPKVAEEIARETGVTTALLNPLGGLAQESLDAGKEYFSVMEENLEALKQALK
jgi:zinc transport system substrate-binding protein